MCVRVCVSRVRSVRNCRSPRRADTQQKSPFMVCILRAWSPACAHGPAVAPPSPSATRFPHANGRAPPAPPSSTHTLRADGGAPPPLTCAARCPPAGWRARPFRRLREAVVSMPRPVSARDKHRYNTNMNMSALKTANSARGDKRTFGAYALCTTLTNSVSRVSAAISSAAAASVTCSFRTWRAEEERQTILAHSHAIVRVVCNYIALCALFCIAYVCMCVPISTKGARWYRTTAVAALPLSSATFARYGKSHAHLALAM